MLEKTKPVLILAFSFFLFFTAIHKTQAAALNFTVDTSVTINAVDYVIKANSEATSVIVGSTTLTVTVPASSTFVFSSPQKYTLSNDSGIATVCGVSETTLTIDGAATVVITPSTVNACAGGGASGSRPASSSPVAKQLPKQLPKASATLPVPIVYDFGNILVKLGTKGEACKAWQRFFNDKKNAGLIVDGICGRLTIKAAKAWQISVGLKPDGILGPMSRAKANEK